MPRATIVIATYNWSSVLPFSIGSTLRQTVSDLEVLVIGDCCTDDSEQVVSGMGDERVQWINLPERCGHQSGPNNEGLRRATSPVVFYLGHDDLWFPHHVSALLEKIDAGADIAHGLLLRVLTDGKLDFVPRPGPLAEGSVVPPTGFCHRKALGDRLGGWTDYRECFEPPELDLLDRYRANGARVGSTNRITAVKFPASQRPGVYSSNPCHEQQDWYERIGGDPNLEARLLGDLLAEHEMIYGPRPIGQEVSRLLRTVQSRLRKKISARESGTARIDRSKRRKGSD